jgi:hypothetical protein
VPGARGDLPRGGSPEAQCFGCLQRLAPDPAARHLERAYGSGGRKSRRGRRLDCRAHLGRRRMRHLGYPAGIALSQKECARCFPNWPTLDASEYRQRACGSRDREASPRTRNEHPWSSPVDQEGPVPVSQRARYGCAGCIAIRRPQLSQTRPVDECGDCGLASPAPHGKAPEHVPSSCIRSDLLLTDPVRAIAMLRFYRRSAGSRPLRFV